MEMEKQTKEGRANDSAKGLTLALWEVRFPAPLQKKKLKPVDEKFQSPEGNSSLSTTVQCLRFLGSFVCNTFPFYVVSLSAFFSYAYFVMRYFCFCAVPSALEYSISFLFHFVLITCSLSLFLSILTICFCAAFIRSFYFHCFSRLAYVTFFPFGFIVNVTFVPGCRVYSRARVVLRFVSIEHSTGAP